MSVNGQRMSKTLGNVVDPIEAADRLGVDPLRLFLVKEVTYGGDGDFSWERLQERYNVDLANNLGNLVSRIAAMAEKYRGRIVQRPARRGACRKLRRRPCATIAKHMDAFALEKGAAARSG